MSLLAGITHQNSAEFILFQHTVALSSYRFHFFKEILNFQMR